MSNATLPTTWRSGIVLYLASIYVLMSIRISIMGIMEGKRLQRNRNQSN